VTVGGFPPTVPTLVVKTVISPTLPPLKLISTVTVIGYLVMVLVGNRLERELWLEGESFERERELHRCFTFAWPHFPFPLQIYNPQLFLQLHHHIPDTTKKKF
jgi:hypothetical protein